MQSEVTLQIKLKIKSSKRVHMQSTLWRHELIAIHHISMRNPSNELVLVIPNVE
jgi:hypothetical protein